MDDTTTTTDTTITSPDTTTYDSDHHTYAYKNEVSLAIGDEPATISPTISPTPSPRHHNTSQTEILIPNDSVDSGVSLRNGKKMGLDNPAFESEPKPRPLSSFGQNGLNDTVLGVKPSNGKAPDKQIAGKVFFYTQIYEMINFFVKFPEAVNLELINLNKPSNGHHDNGLPIKKDTEVEIGDPYDEYFVPVNEHRKYMR